MSSSFRYVTIPPPRLLECCVPVLLALGALLSESRRIGHGVVEEGPQRCSRRVFDAVADDEDLDLRPFLRESAADCIRGAGGMPMCGSEDRRVDQAAPTR